MADAPVEAGTKSDGTETNPPKSNYDSKPGEPSNSKNSRGVYNGTPNQKSDENRSHVCDFSQKLKYDIAINRGEVKAALQKARKEVEDALASDAASPLVTQLKAALKWITNKLKMLNKIIKAYNDIVKEIASYIQYVQEMIAYILSLPAQLAALLTKCLSELKAALSSALSMDFGGSGGLSEVGELLKTAKTTVGLTAQAAATTAGVASAAIATSSALQGSSFNINSIRPA
jgi:flagellar hook-basal body complex protein FliE